ncbi:hypothetical protein [Silvania hatchlandensis]|uniref:Uncharacterized protein n=1 Tax=Silvania hatchlandensis TaxID=2926469 RepID=A0A9J6Q300_9ENTR|nr:hypothetical protein [Silvania hatchlandensis]MCU6666072.1 hypothetical protein [Silvania hatchlandensis]
MRDLYLRFSDATDMRQALITFGFQDNEEQGYLYHPGICLDVVGVISTTVGEEDPFEYLAEPGYHVNLRVVDDALDLTGLDGFTVNPKTPARVWA